jgi:hypothetical protein
VEGTAIVESGSAQREKVLGCLGDCFAEDFEFDVTT